MLDGQGVDIQVGGDLVDNFVDEHAMHSQGDAESEPTNAK